MTLQIPLAMLFDVVFKSKTFSSLFYVGTIPMCGSLLFVGFLMKNEDSDPLWQLIKITYRKLCLCKRPNIVRYGNYFHSQYPFELVNFPITCRVSDLDEQHESLINNYDNQYIFGLFGLYNLHFRQPATTITISLTEPIYRIMPGTKSMRNSCAWCHTWTQIRSCCCCRMILGLFKY